MDEVRLVFVPSSEPAELRAVRGQLRDLAEREATKLYRLAWRMKAHGCDPANVEACRNEARLLHGQMTATPGWLLDDFRRWRYAFRF